MGGGASRRREVRPRGVRRRPWSAAEEAVIVRHGRQGAAAVAARLPGRSAQAVAVRACRLGISLRPDNDPTGRPLPGAPRDGKPRAEPAQNASAGGNAGRRRCLACGGPFASEGAHNRICGACKKTPAWRAGAALGAPAFGGAPARAQSRKGAP